MTYKLNTNFKCLGIKVKNYSFLELLKSNIKEIERKLEKTITIDYLKKIYWTNVDDIEINVKLAVKNNDKFYYNINYKIQKGFLTDFASVPKIFRNIVQKNGVEILIPAVIHDTNYEFSFFSFSDSNKILREMLKFNGMGFIKRNLVYLAVCTPIAKAGYKKHAKNKNDFVKIDVTIKAK